MTPKEFAETERTHKAPCGCRVHVDGNQRSCKHGKDCALKQPESKQQTPVAKAKGDTK